MFSKQNAFFVRNRSASIQMTIFAMDNMQARKIAREIIGYKNKSLLRVVHVSDVRGYN